MFDSYEFTGLKAFIIQENRKTVGKILYDVQKFNRKDNIVTLVSLKFSINAYRNLSHTEILELSSTAADLFHLIREFGKVNNIKNEITLCLVDDQLRESTSDACGMFQLYFYKNLFDPLHNRKIINDEQLTKETVLKNLNELFL